MLYDCAFILFGYLSGSLLFAEIAAELTGKQALLRESRDGNPGTASAFSQCGFLCGVITLLGDLSKGFLPIYLYLRWGGSLQEFSLLKPLVLAAPVIGHALPLFYRFRGGKGIAVSFGCLLGLLPMSIPLLLQAGFYLLFSLIIRISPHSNRTITTYLMALAGMLLFSQPSVVFWGYLLITTTVIAKHHFSAEPKEKGEVKLLWMH